jgi:hypothetical protein
MKIITSLTLMFFAMVPLTLGATLIEEPMQAVTIEGKIQGISYITDGKLYPIDSKDPLVVTERLFVLVEGNGSKKFYLISNLDRKFLAKHIGKNVRVRGEFDSRYNHKSLKADTFETLNKGAWKTVWSLKTQERIDREWQERMYENAGG